MFERQFRVKVYREGQYEPFVQFVVVSSYAKVEGHTLIVDGARVKFAENEYIVVETIG